MGYSVSQSLISSQPPLIVFTICLTAFGFTMVVLAYVVGEKEIPNPDVKMDWNRYFMKVANLRLCPLRNYTRNANGDIISENFPGSLTALNSSALHVVDESKSMSAVLSGVVDLAMDGGWHESMFVDVSVTAKFGLQGKLPSNSFNLKGQIKGNLLGFPGKYGRLLYNVSLSFRPLHNDNCTNGKCYINYEVCITMSWPADFLPKTKGPERCKAKEYRNVLPVLFSELPLSKEDESSKTCMELNYTPDAKLTEMLSLHERSIVNLHLMHTSYFMFVMVMTLVCYSLIKGRSRQPTNYTSLQKVLDA